MTHSSLCPEDSIAVLYCYHHYKNLVKPYLLVLLTETCEKRKERYCLFLLVQKMRVTDATFSTFPSTLRTFDWISVIILCKQKSHREKSIYHIALDRENIDYKIAGKGQNRSIAWT